VNHTVVYFYKVDLLALTAGVRSSDLTFNSFFFVAEIG
jgi:hypothetical protein